MQIKLSNNNLHKMEIRLPVFEELEYGNHRDWLETISFMLKVQNSTMGTPCGCLVNGNHLELDCLLDCCKMAAREVRDTSEE